MWIFELFQRQAILKNTSEWLVLHWKSDIKPLVLRLQRSPSSISMWNVWQWILKVARVVNLKLVFTD